MYTYDYCVWIEWINNILSTCHYHGLPPPPPMTDCIIHALNHCTQTRRILIYILCYPSEQCSLNVRFWRLRSVHAPKEVISFFYILSINLYIFRGRLPRKKFWPLPKGHKFRPYTTRISFTENKTLIQRWFNVGPASQTMGQHSTNIGSTSRICLIEGTPWDETFSMLSILKI